MAAGGNIQGREPREPLETPIQRLYCIRFAWRPAMIRTVLPACLAVASLLGIPAARAEVVIRADGTQSQYQYVNPMGQSLQWLFGPQMEKELEIVPEQTQALGKLRAEVMEKMQSLWTVGVAGDGNIDREERLKRYAESSKALAEETDKKVREILLPHQLRRLSQIALQMKLAQTGYGGSQALAGDDVAQELGITDEQKAELREKEQEVQKEVREKTQEFYKKLQEESREKLLSILTPAQRKKLADMIGEKFEWQSQGWGGAAAIPAAGGIAPAVQRIEIDRLKGSIESLKSASRRGIESRPHRAPLLRRLASPEETSFSRGD